MKKIFIICLFVFSCNTNETVKPVALIERVEYIELTYDKQPCIIIDIKVNDSLLSDKLKNKELREFRIQSIAKKDRNYFFYEVWKAPIKKGNTFSFLIRTGFFMQNISDRDKKEKRIWNKDNIAKLLNGDISLIFDKDSIRVKASNDRKIVLQMLNE